MKSGAADAAESEVRATTVEINYLNGEKDKLRNRQEKPAIVQRVTQMTDYKNQNQKIVDQSGSSTSQDAGTPTPTPTPPAPEEQTQPTEGGQ